MSTRTRRFAAAFTAAAIGTGALLGLGTGTASAAPAPVPAAGSEFAMPVQLASMQAPLPGATQPADAKPGLMSSDVLQVIAETGEWDGDEPVMLTVRITSVLGQAGSTKVTLVNTAPGQIASGVDAGDQVGIPDRDGDVWFGVQPLTADTVMTAVAEHQPVPIPVVATATIMLEGDFSNGAMIGAMGQTVADHLQQNLAPQLENTRIMMDDAGQVTGYADALDRIGDAAIPSTVTLTTLAVQKIADWGTAVGDPDDPVGMNMTALVPVDQGLVDIVDTFGGAATLGLDAQYQRVTTHEVRTAPFDTDIQVRTGLLVPPSALGGRVQEWWTSYKGDYLYDDPAEYRVLTQAWPQITW